MHAHAVVTRPFFSLPPKGLGTRLALCVAPPIIIESSFHFGCLDNGGVRNLGVRIREVPPYNFFSIDADTGAQVFHGYSY